MYCHRQGHVFGIGQFIHSCVIGKRQCWFVYAFIAHKQHPCIVVAVAIYLFTIQSFHSWKVILQRFAFLQQLLLPETGCTVLGKHYRLPRIQHCSPYWAPLLAAMALPLLAFRTCGAEQPSAQGKGQDYRTTNLDKLAVLKTLP